MKLTCDCEKWKPFITEHCDMVKFCYSYMWTYKSGKFVYCPFCGKKLKEE